MPYFLKHYFDPYFDHRRLRPAELKNGSVDHRNLSYVQNVVDSQVLAEWQSIAENEVEQYDPNFIFQDKEVELGTNCQFNDDNPEQIVATANGYVFYEQGRITVKTVLNVRQAVDFHTGNIHFVGDLILHDKVKSGFTVQARDIRIKGIVEGAKIDAEGSLLVEQGVKGQNSGLLRAKKRMRLSFVEKATLQSTSHILIDGACLHCNAYTNGSLAVKGKMIGGNYYVQSQVYVTEQLGGGLSTKTCLILGKNPFLLLKSEQLESKILALGKQIEEMKHRAKHGNDVAKLQEDIARKEAQYLAYTKKLGIIWEKLNSDRDYKSRVIVPGEVRPGVQISIGSAYLKNEDFLRDVCFYCQNGEIKVQSPAPGL